MIVYSHKDTLWKLAEADGEAVPFPSVPTEQTKCTDSHVSIKQALFHMPYSLEVTQPVRKSRLTHVGIHRAYGPTMESSVMMESTRFVA